ncbi:MAG: CBS domain-containing protein [Magnetococcales bacterium]|nr:CBS domain-containing protein [Magnetococcales bacterium]
METPESVIKNAKPFFEGYFQNLSKDLTELTTVPVVCTLVSVGLLRGKAELAPLFAGDRSVAFAEEDSAALGDLHLVFDTPLSIALAGTLMQTDPAVTQEKMESRDYDEECQEGFREVATQIVTSINRQLEEKLAKGEHLFLEATEHNPAGALPETLADQITYLVANVEVKTAEFPSVAAHWLISRKFAESILKTEIPASAQELADEKGMEADEADITALAAGHPDGLVMPQVEGSIRLLMTEAPFSLKAEEPVNKGITAVTHDGHRYIGIEHKGMLIRVLSRSDIHQVMGPFHGSGAPAPRDKALYALPLGKINAQQQLVKIASNGTIEEAANLMQAHNLHMLPVVNSRGGLRGFVPIQAMVDYYRKMGRKGK